MTELPRPVTVADIYLEAVLDELKAIKLQLVQPEPEPEPELVDGDEIELKELAQDKPRIFKNFPGHDALAEAGIIYMEDVPETGADLVAIPGIGNATANKILTWFKT